MASTFKKAILPVCLSSIVFGTISVVTNYTNFLYRNDICNISFVKNEKYQIRLIATTPVQNDHRIDGELLSVFIQDHKTNISYSADIYFDANDKNPSDAVIMNARAYNEMGIFEGSAIIPNQYLEYIVDGIHSLGKDWQKNCVFPLVTGVRMTMASLSIIYAVLFPMLFILFYTDKPCKCHGYDRHGNIIEVPPAD